MQICFKYTLAIFYTENLTITGWRFLPVLWPLMLWFSFHAETAWSHLQSLSIVLTMQHFEEWETQINTKIANLKIRTMKAFIIILIKRLIFISIYIDITILYIWSEECRKMLKQCEQPRLLTALVSLILLSIVALSFCQHQRQQLFSAGRFIISLLPFLAFFLSVFNVKMSMLIKRASGLARQLARPLVASRNLASAAPYGDGTEVLVERLDGARQGISVIGLNRPAAKNSFSRGMVETFNDVLEDIKKDNGSRVVVLRSLSPGIFCAGADLKERKG